MYALDCVSLPQLLSLGDELTNVPGNILQITVTQIDKNGEAKSVQESFPLPEVEDPFVYNNSIGLSYEAAAVQLAVIQGRTEVEEFTHEESRTLARIEVCLNCVVDLISTSAC